MQIAIFGSGYVGLVTGTCFAAADPLQAERCIGNDAACSRTR